MLFIKNVLKPIVFSCITLTSFISCSEDSSSDDQKPEEIVVEDFENFAKDSKFKEHMKNFVLVLNRIEDHEKAIEILETSGKSRLNDIHQMELTLALGFENTEQMNTAYDQLTEEWELLNHRFDLSNQNYVHIDNLIFHELLLNRYDLDLSEVLGLKKKELSNKELNCYNDICIPPYLYALKPFDTARTVCDGIDRSTTEGNKLYFECIRPIRQLFALELERADFFFACCSFYGCGIERPTVVGGEAFNYSKCPQAPLSKDY